jgi:hypothetical protein
LRFNNFRHGLGWEPDRFVYRAGPVPLGTGRTGIVPTGSLNPAPRGPDRRSDRSTVPASCWIIPSWYMHVSTYTKYI